MQRSKKYSAIDHVVGIRTARKAAAHSLVSAIRALPANYSEANLATKWRSEICTHKEVLPFGWYQPPPFGMSVLIGSGPDYERLDYGSLREESNWPSAETRMTTNSILYPYFSAVDFKTGMIGDFVGTFYRGKIPEIREWIREVYKATLSISEFATPGKYLSEIYDFADSIMKSLGSLNNTFSMTSGTEIGADIGHTIPRFAESFDPLNIWTRGERNVVTSISKARTFVNHSNHSPIGKNSAFTIEPQMLVPGLPMASFHLIVAFADGEKFVISEFDEIFRLFGMSEWLS